ncbi:MerR family DNA-binding transcriptional regulator [Glutamicibacter sp. NPDC087673]|uniref:MerR family transcriptional regulator n=1 Tax=Glutamicibacter sp. NPDC087673 TaxID=3363997 RepID=UPI00382517C8
MTGPRYVTISQAAAMVRRSIDTIRRWDKSELLPNTRRGPGGRRLIYTADLDKVMAHKGATV